MCRPSALPGKGFIGVVWLATIPGKGVPMSQWQFWIDRGGTFTDVVARDPEGGYHTHKLLSEAPERYADAALQGIRDLMGVAPEAAIPAEQVLCVKMGTTVATNALLERKGERVILLVSRGFADALRIGNQTRPQLFELDIKLPELLYERVVEIGGRYRADGVELEPVGAAGARRASLSHLKEKENGGGSPGTRTQNQRVKSPVLCQLS